METVRGVGEAPTLGTYVSDLRPGSACVCCGTALHRIEGRGTARATTQGRLSLEESGSLACPNCGCEIVGLSADQAADEAGHTLTRAA
jgi:hypothetical protein